MKLARVAGPVVSTIKHPTLEGRTLLLCDYVSPNGESTVSPNGEETGRYTIAVDTVGAGAGELVLILDEGSSARQVIAEKQKTATKPSPSETAGSAIRPVQYQAGATAAAQAKRSVHRFDEVPYRK